MNTELLNALSDIANARQAFFRRHSVIPFSLMRQFLANESSMLAILGRFPVQLGNVGQTTRPTQIDIPINLLDALFPNLAGGGNGTFWDAVTVHLTPAQLAAGLRDYTPEVGSQELCCICQEGIATQPCVSLATCGHHMHRGCGTTWFTISTRCPVCRGDLRSLNQTNTNAGAAGSEPAPGSGVHPDVQPTLLP